MLFMGQSSQILIEKSFLWMILKICIISAEKIKHHLDRLNIFLDWMHCAQKKKTDLAGNMRLLSAL